MDTKSVNKVAPVKPYDDSMWDIWKIYDGTPYMMDKDVCNESNIAMLSGNIIKSYRCLIKEPYEVKYE